ncbi:MAG: hypothetical protein HKN23_15905 [Verrucomicrobiales bacterium]|nr:hypothetical protein [Verrucomicrobiales bacterium]
MIQKLFLCAFATVALFAFTGCITTKNANEPPREQLSSMPHNMPESWEGRGQFGAMGQY